MSGETFTDLDDVQKQLTWFMEQSQHLRESAKTLHDDVEQLELELRRQMSGLDKLIQKFRDHGIRRLPLSEAETAEFEVEDAYYEGTGG